MLIAKNGTQLYRVIAKNGVHISYRFYKKDAQVELMPNDKHTLQLLKEKVIVSVNDLPNDISNNDTNNTTTGDLNATNNLNAEQSISNVDNLNKKGKGK